MQQSIGAINPTYARRLTPMPLPPSRQPDQSAWRELARLEQENRQLRWILADLGHLSNCIGLMAEQCANDAAYLADKYARETAPQPLTPDNQ